MEMVESSPDIKTENRLDPVVTSGRTLRQARIGKHSTGGRMLSLPWLRNQRRRWGKVFDVIAEDTTTDSRFRMEVRPAPMEHR